MERKWRRIKIGEGGNNRGFIRRGGRMQWREDINDKGRLKTEKKNCQWTRVWTDRQVKQLNAPDNHLWEKFSVDFSHTFYSLNFHEIICISKNRNKDVVIIIQRGLFANSRIITKTSLSLCKVVVLWMSDL